MKLFLPNHHVQNVYEITPGMLKEHEIKGIITDLDNTLIEWDRPNATPELENWFLQMKEAGIKVTVVSNNNEQRVRDFCEPLGIPFIHRAKKPMTRAFKRAVALMNVKKQECVMVGDQLMTDVLGGNRMGLRTILVVPVAQTDGFFTKFNRKMEKSILRILRKKGLLHWEE
ncbi:MAG: YqeG family HAD IIIA-type phosphatase [Bacillaceae bacterium]